MFRALPGLRGELWAEDADAEHARHAATCTVLGARPGLPDQVLADFANLDFSRQAPCSEHFQAYPGQFWTDDADADLTRHAPCSEHF